MLDITLLELPRGRTQDLRAGRRGSAIDQSHGILQLVSKAVRYSRLVKRRTCPKAAGEDLINEPPVDHKVDPLIGCCYVQRVEVAIPLLLHLLQRFFGTI